MIQDKALVAKIRRISFENIHREHHSTNLKKWDMYREDKLGLVKNYIAVLKDQKRVKLFILFKELLGVLLKVRENMQGLRAVLGQKFAELLLAIRCYVRFHVTAIQKRLGSSYEFRE